MSDDVAVRIAGLTKRFPVRRTFFETARRRFRHDYVTVVHSVSCEIRTGEFFGLLGQNGAGKTTLFKMLSTLVLADEGTASVGGFDVATHGSDVRRVLAPVIANERSLQWRLPARENLRLFGTLRGLWGEPLRQRIEEVLDVVGLPDVGDKLVGLYSSGMRQRLMIAQALLSRPRVLLLDEPTRSLDPISARNFRQFLKQEISRKQGCTVLLATHNAEEALELCDRVGVLDRGRLLALGTPTELGLLFGDERYLLWTKTPAHPSLAALAEGGTLDVLTTDPADVPGWYRVVVEVHGGVEQAAHVLDVLTCAGVSISRFEPMTLSLADLIQRVVERHGGEGA